MHLQRLNSYQLRLEQRAPTKKFLLQNQETEEYTHKLQLIKGLNW